MAAREAVYGWYVLLVPSNIKRSNSIIDMRALMT